MGEGERGRVEGVREGGKREGEGDGVRYGRGRGGWSEEGGME